MKILDLFSGLGGFSQAFKDRNHYVVRMDINPKFNPDITDDIKSFSPKEYYDVILASPPCTEFTKTLLPKTWVCNIRTSPNPDTELLEHAVRIINTIKPKYWIIENVRGAVKYFESIIGNYVKKVGSRYLWGEFPIFDTVPVYGKWMLPRTPNRSALRSKIPYSLSYSLCRAIETDIK